MTVFITAHLSTLFWANTMQSMHCSFKFNFNIIISSTPRSHKWFLSPKLFWLQLYIHSSLPPTPQNVTCSTHIISHDFIILMTWHGVTDKWIHQNVTDYRVHTGSSISLWSFSSTSCDSLSLPKHMHLKIIKMCKVHLLYEAGCVIPRVRNLTKEQ
jgi:hypothetical protein